MPPILLLAALALLTATAPAQPSAALTDTRDGKNYRAVKIGEHVWMAENLNYNAEGSKCYDNKSENCTKYGRLYDLQTAMKVCPKGWHLSKNEEWDVLYKYVDSSYVAKDGLSKVASKYLKAKSFEGKYGNGEDKFGFAGLPGGAFYSRSFGHLNDYGLWWSASEKDADKAYTRIISFDDSEYVYWSNATKTYMFSVRCVRD